MFLAVVFTCLAAFLLLCWLMSDKIAQVVRWATKAHERISVLEDSDLAQNSRLDRQHAQIRMVKQDLRELGKDVGWGDDKTKTQLAKTQVMFPQAKPDDEPPDDAA